MTAGSKILQVPVPGGSGKMPSGAIQFQNDWPGLFVRGNEAIDLLANIRALQQRLDTHPDTTIAAALIKLGKIADLIEREVVV